MGPSLHMDSIMARPPSWRRPILTVILVLVIVVLWTWDHGSGNDTDVITSVAGGTNQYPDRGAGGPLS